DVAGAHGLGQGGGPAQAGGGGGPDGDPHRRPAGAGDDGGFGPGRGHPGGVDTRAACGPARRGHHEEPAAGWGGRSGGGDRGTPGWPGRGGLPGPRGWAATRAGAPSALASASRSVAALASAGRRTAAAWMVGTPAPAPTAPAGTRLATVRPRSLPPTGERRPI